MAGITNIVKHLIIINVLMFLGTQVMGESLAYRYMSLFSFESELFRPWQIVTHMFMHGSLSHLFFNMFGLWMFGSVLERTWGSKNFLQFYIFTGLGAALLYLTIKYIQQYYMLEDLTPYELTLIKEDGANAILEGSNFRDLNLRKLNSLINTPMVGASAAIMGLLLAFGMKFPNTELMLIFLPIPIKAKYFIPLIILGEAYLEFANFSWDNIAHMAHLSGIIIGFILFKRFNKQNFNRWQ